MDIALFADVGYLISICVSSKSYFLFRMGDCSVEE